ncbi:uncharacterized protein HRG_05005 [Hirsutella rhossiliensis]|uniref:Uncharacterized protein n=1 Tax=Hirsutella rhossiliensis TaxID=111463 RepID=A0A9P8N0D4_9HYPO|nr:uncharacterized protein HRG_05005 [Hirsutella rhossiliensis]KAH0964577.1 hypothetical protein HRG_05005 [Hirsutella rhossiliensis]
MASVCNRKRPNTDRLSQDSTPARRLKAARGHRETNFPPSFWDDLSKVWLTPRALRELDRRSKAPRQPTLPIAPVDGDLARFARRGGPDLRHLRGFSGPTQDTPVMDATPSSSTPSRSRRTQSTKAIKVDTRSGKSSAYNKDFQQHLIDHKIYPVGYDYTDGLPDPEPGNLGDTYDELKQNVLFTELEPITSESAVKPKPDFFDGARLQDLSQELRDDQNLRSTIFPTKHPRVPVAPNFFLEACYDGAYGARIMQDLQKYGEAEPIYDGNAYTYSSTYYAGTGTLQLYAHHATAPSTVEGRPEYHMTQIDTWGMTGNVDAFRRGATAFRNARYVANRHRNAFIRTANARAAQAARLVQEDITEAPGQGRPEYHMSQLGAIQER